jgi:hypothetical protein
MNDGKGVAGQGLPMIKMKRGVSSSLQAAIMDVMDVNVDNET